jgi:eukaryotic-like serine/threonine-protein kinase
MQVIDAEKIAECLSELKDVEYLAQGGQKLVYTCIIDDEKYALKLIGYPKEYPPEIHVTIEKRVLREIEIMKKIQSRFFIKSGPLKPVTITIDGEPYFVYTEEFIDGMDLKTYLKKQPLTINEAITMVNCLTATIKELWENNYVHRDIKPANIMINNVGDFILLDAGVAFDHTDESLTVYGPVGTQIYMSPEQMNNSGTGRSLDFRSDLFSMGIVLYEALTQQHPFIQPNNTLTHVIGNILSAKPKPITEINKEVTINFERIINRLLAKRPNMRYRTCQLLQNDLNTLSEER